MARAEHDREDLLAEASALVERAKLRVAGEVTEIVAGFRRDGSLSIFYDAQPVYQFNSAGELRRAFVNDVLYKAQDGKLAALEKHRTSGRIELVSRPLDEQQTQAVASAMLARLAELQIALRQGRIELEGQAPEGADVPGRLLAWLQTHAHKWQVARRPNVG